MNRSETPIEKHDFREPDYPEVRVAGVNESKCLIICSILKRLADKGWGKDTFDEEIFQSLDPKEWADEFDAFLERTNEEALEWVAFARDRSPEEQNEIMGQLVEHKGITEDEAKKLFVDFFSFISRFEQENQSLISRLESASLVDMEAKQGSLESVSENLNSTVDFFQPVAGVREVA